MADQDKRINWVIGGSTLVGLGVGLLYLEESGLYFVGSLMVGIGAGLVISQLLPRTHDE